MPTATLCGQPDRGRGHTKSPHGETGPDNTVI